MKKSFSVGNKVRVHHLRAQLASCRQDGQSVIDYYGRLALLWDELYTYKPLPTVSDASGVTFSQEREEEKVTQFLMGLDESRFGNVINSLIDAEPAPDVAQAFARVRREEQRQVSSKLRESEDVVGFVTRREDCNISDSMSLAPRPDIFSPTSTNRNRDRNVLCSHCGKSGHEKNFCWQLHGYPEWWTECSSQNGGRGATRGGRGSQHMSSGRGRGSAHVAHATSSNGSAFPDFTAEEWKALSMMAKEKTNGGGGSSSKISGKIMEDIIIVTGASHHMTGNRLISYLVLLDLRTEAKRCLLAWACSHSLIRFSFLMFYTSQISIVL